MKRLIVPVLIVCLILCGCAAQPESDHGTPVTEFLPATEPTGIYDAASQIEHFTAGAVKAFPLSAWDVADTAAMGSNILLFSGTTNTTLTGFSGTSLEPVAALTLNCKITPADSAVRISDAGVTYYDAPQNDLVFLDAQLQELRRVELPDTLCGTPALAEDLQTVYYCTADSLHCLNLETKLDRLVKEMYFSYQTTAALHCSDTVIACDVQVRDGSRKQLYISTETGVLLYEAPADLLLQTSGSSYFARLMDGIYPELLVGDSEQGPTLLVSPTYDSTVFPLLEMGAAVLATENESSRAVQLDYYDLHSGKRTSSITLHGAEDVRSVFSGNEPLVWFTRYDPAYDCDVLYCWDIRKSTVHDDRNYFSTRHTAVSPDLDGLAYCRDLADSLSRKYGVQILLWTDATAYQPWDYTLIPEYQVSVVYENLKELERFLSMYPEGFLQKAAERTGSGQILICLVRSILGKESINGVLPEAVGLQYWDHNANTYLCLAVQPENLFRNACHEMSHIIDSRVLTVCKAYDDWASLNPDGFSYNHAGISSLSLDDRRWTVGSDRAFLDLYSMTFPKEDRARIMEFAMMDGYEASFESDILQKKLRTICLGIRKAFDLESSPDAFCWEQYLKNPLYTK